MATGDPTAGPSTRRIRLSPISSTRRRVPSFDASSDTTTSSSSDSWPSMLCSCVSTTEAPLYVAMQTEIICFFVFRRGSRQRQSLTNSCKITFFHAFRGTHPLKARTGAAWAAPQNSAKVSVFGKTFSYNRIYGQCEPRQGWPRLYIKDKRAAAGNIAGGFRTLPRREQPPILFRIFPVPSFSLCDDLRESFSDRARGKPCCVSAPKGSPSGAPRAGCALISPPRRQDGNGWPRADRA